MNSSYVNYIWCIIWLHIYIYIYVCVCVLKICNPGILLLSCSVLWILSLLSWAFDYGTSSLRQKCGSYEVSGVLMSNLLMRLCDSNLLECLIGWWLTGLLSYLDCALILVVEGKVPVVGFPVVVAFRMFVRFQSSKTMTRVEGIYIYTLQKMKN